LFSGARDDVAPTRTALTALLKAFTDADASPEDFLTEFTNTWLNQRQAEGRLDWRYYLVRYPCMREGATGIYYGSGGALGYSLCMLRRTQLNSYYRDPFLLAILQESGVGESVKDPWFTGYPTAPRWMELRNSGTGLQSLEAGIALNPPSLETHRTVFDELCLQRDDIVEVDGDFRVSIAQRGLADGTVVDTEDRVRKGVLVLKALVEAGL
jgi:hypothetical protein